VSRNVLENSKNAISWSFILTDFDEIFSEYVLMVELYDYEKINIFFSSVELAWKPKCQTCQKKVLKVMSRIVHKRGNFEKMSKNDAFGILKFLLNLKVF
jgi:hypothetical protein